ncbi:MAG: hydrolase [Firmicutes bacterium]|nr:hydrolase [Bacillota bacterium]
MHGSIEKGGFLLKKDAFINRQPGIIGADRCRQYSVLIPLLREGETTSMLFEKRSKNLRRQPGEICFPGGKQEPDETQLECAIREAAEELAIQREQISIIGTGDIYISPFNMIIHPFIGDITDYHDTFSTDEVEEIIKVPLEFFRNCSPEVFVGKLINEPAENFPYEWIPGGIEYPWTKGTHEVLFYRYHSWTIWGMTAHIVQSAIKLIDEYMVG